MSAHDLFCITFFAGGILFALYGAVATYRNHKRLQRMAEACRRKKYPLIYEDHH